MDGFRLKPLESRLKALVLHMYNNWTCSYGRQAGRFLLQ